MNEDILIESSWTFHWSINIAIGMRKLARPVAKFRSLSSFSDERVCFRNLLLVVVLFFA